MMISRRACKYWLLLVVLASVLPCGRVLAAPAVSAVYYPANMEPNIPYRLYAVVSSTTGVASCTLYIDGADRGAMHVQGVEAASTSTFPEVGTYMALIKCTDAEGEGGSGLPTPIDIRARQTDDPGTSSAGSPSAQGSQSPSGSTPASPSSPSTNSSPSSPSVPSSGSVPSNEGESGGRPDLTVPPSSGGALIKLVCPDGAAADHPCKAVYYFGKDGKRHAFPNEKVYFTWYANFDSVQTISDGAMSEISLGNNVTYRPGVKMVKFTTVNDVYAVSKSGNLRWVRTEDVARNLYGDDWNKKIDDISDAFYSNYVFGASVSSTNDYSVSDALSSATTVDESL
jgi:hypothetical protein